MKHEEVISKMTVKEKASLMSGKTVWETQEITRLGIPSLFLSDGPTGLRKQLGASDQLGLNESQKSTCFPTANTIANSFNVDIGREIGIQLGKEARELDVNVLLGPGMNIKRNPLCGRCFEYFSEDPYLAGKMALSYVEGIQSQGVGSCVKHFACNNQELRRMQNDSVLDERTLREIYLTGFEMAITEGHPAAVMSAYNSVNGDFANENKHLLVDILREEWSFDGAIITDWGGNNDRVKALECYCSLEMPTTVGETDREIVKAIEDKTIDESALDTSVDYLLNVIDRYRREDGAKPEPIDFAAGSEISLQAALESIVLLKNDGNLLPLTEGTKVAIIGDFAKTPRFQGAGSSKVNPPEVIDHVSAITSSKAWMTVGYEQGYERYGKKSKGLARKALELAKKADVVLYFIGLDEHTEVEGLDRKSFKLNDNQIALLKELRKTGKKIVTILSCGAAVELKEVDENTDSLLYPGLSGQCGAKAIVKVLAGEVSPSGKLSESFPLAYEDISTSKYFPGKAKTSEYREGLFVGYRYYTTRDIKVLYPFGYGLSYAKFEYSDLKVDDKGVSFTVTNVSDVPAKEVAQMYVSLPQSKIFRVKMELKGFVKVEIAPHESKTCRIDFDKYTFRYFNVRTNRFEVEEGDYEILVGSSSVDILLRGMIHREGTTTELPYQDLHLPHYQSGDVQQVPDEEFAALLGRPIPDSRFETNAKGRYIITSNTTMRDLVNAQGWFGRFFGKGVRFGIKVLRFFGARSTADMLVQGVWNQTVKTISRMTNGFMSWGQLLGMIDMFNGHFFRGLKTYFREGKKKKQLKKELKKNGEKC